MSTVGDYERLEREHGANTRLADHSAAWAKLKPLGDTNGNTRVLIEAFCQSKRISLGALVALDTRVDVDAHGGVDLAWGYAHRGFITAVKFRPLGDKPRYTLRPSTYLKPLVIGERGSLDWFLAEGETEACRLYDLVGDEAAILLLPAGALTFKREWADVIPRGATVHPALDADETGDKGADKAARIIGGKTVRVRPPDGFKDWCEWPGSRDEFVRLVQAARAARVSERPFSLSIQEFIALERPTAEALVLDVDGRPLIARYSLTMLGALGGAGKTTFFIELALHLAAGVDYLCFFIPAPASVLLIENEGPEDMFALKLAEKLKTFPHELKAHIAICTADWGSFTLGDTRLADRLREELTEHHYDLVFGDPLDSLGIEGVGSPEDTRKFFDLLKETGLHKDVAWWINTHPRKEETKEALNEISGAWGGKPDAVLLLKMLADDRSQVRFPKLRWAKRGRRPAIVLAFDPDTETFTFLAEEEDVERNYLSEVTELLGRDGKWRTPKEISAPKKPKKDSGIEPGIGANADAIKNLLKQHPDTFISRTGEDAREVGRHPSATVWQLFELPEVEF